VLSVSAVVGAYAGPADVRAALAAQLRPGTALPHEAYLRALTVDRPRLQAAVAAAMAAARVTALVCPTAPVAAVPPGGGGAGTSGAGGSDDTVDVNGTPVPARRLLQAATALPAAAGLPALTVPVGATKPKPGAVAGTAGAERLPVGLLLLGPPGGDAALLALGRGVQALQSLLPDPVAMRAWGGGVTQA
jgi:Asp-tRNA(Asn)/Glu-tRNA(Gln) amidotransferase A subunit family amidase